MRRLVRWALFPVLASLFAAASAGCATYAQDLDRARQHYEANRYEQALALFRVLEHDMDSFSPAEQAQYCYLRGMNDYRLAELAPQGTGVADPRKAFRDNARHWLALAAATEKNTPGSISNDQKQRLGDALNDLNRDVYGGAEALGETGAPVPGGAAVPAPGGAAVPAPGAMPAPGPMPPMGPPPPPSPR